MANRRYTVEQFDEVFGDGFSRSGTVPGGFMGCWGLDERPAVVVSEKAALPAIAKRLLDMGVDFEACTSENGRLFLVIDSRNVADE